jgi:cytoskeletal protein RodZ
VVARCLAVDPDARFQRVSDLARALAPFASQHRANLAVSDRSVRRGLRPQRLRTWRLALVAVLTAATVALIASARAPVARSPTSTTAAPSPAATSVMKSSQPAMTRRLDGASFAPPVLPSPAPPAHHESAPGAHDAGPQRAAASRVAGAHTFQDAVVPPPSEPRAGRRTDAATAPPDAGVDPFATPD